MVQLTTNQVWTELEKNIFAVLGMVTAKHEARTAGIVYVVRDRAIYIGSQKDAWKVKHVAGNPQVSLTVAIPKRVPLMPWIKVPAATITFNGIARVVPGSDISAAVADKVFRGMTNIEEIRKDFAMIEVTPTGDFVTYGVGVSLMEMRDQAKARGRAPVA